MALRSLNSLRVFDLVAALRSFSGAAERLALSQGAVSYRIKQLEDELGFGLFDRAEQPIKLTDAGAAFHLVTRRVLDEIDAAARLLQHRQTSHLTVGVSTYFGSRWLSPRLMRFVARYPDIVLRLQPTIGGADLARADVDIAIVWGTHEDLQSSHELLLRSAVTPMCGPVLAQSIAARLQDGLRGLMLIHEDETHDAWRKWLGLARLSDRHARRGPIVPDSNMRVQAVIDNQGLALFDELVSDELERGQLVAPSTVTLGGFGYYLVVDNPGALRAPVATFLDWLREEASLGTRIEPSKHIVPPTASGLSSRRTTASRKGRKATTSR
jgi:DNA-binding transcriptional LysR family regulator